jgi:ligand-binding sensor domain-containing protein
LTELAKNGTLLSGPAGLTSTGLNLPISVAVDGSNNIWVGGHSGIFEFSNSGNILSGASGFLPGEQGVAIAPDGSGNVWLTSGSKWVVEIIGASAPVVTPIVANLVTPYSAPASKP